MISVGLIAKKGLEAQKHAKVYRTVYDYLVKKGKDVYVQKHIATTLQLKEYQRFHVAKKHVDLIIVMGGDGTILSTVRRLPTLNTHLFGINLGTLGFMSEIPPTNIARTLNKIFDGEFTVDERFTLEIEVRRGNEVIQNFRALNEAVITQGTLARLIRLATKVNDRTLTTYHADGLIVATPTGSTAYSLSAGGPIMYPSMQGFILTPVCPHSFTQKPIVIPCDKRIDIIVKSEDELINLTMDGQTNMRLQHEDQVRIRRGGEIRFVRLPSESFFDTLRQKLHWGERNEKHSK
ncbi:NAD(+)/NADH kinase [Candidatus Peregrinibacteria bacterium]|nr:MAG: NAD(+)/NADH kinase [Candidatus Peregrinibacteria bacterium]